MEFLVRVKCYLFINGKATEKKIVVESDFRALWQNVPHKNKEDKKHTKQNTIYSIAKKLTLNIFSSFKNLYLLVNSSENAEWPPWYGLGMRRYGHHTTRYVSIQKEAIWLLTIRYDTIRVVIVKIQTFMITSGSMGRGSANGAPTPNGRWPVILLCLKS